MYWSFIFSHSLCSSLLQIIRSWNYWFIPLLHCIDWLVDLFIYLFTYLLMNLGYNVIRWCLWRWEIVWYQHQTIPYEFFILQYVIFAANVLNSMRFEYSCLRALAYPFDRKMIKGIQKTSLQNLYSRCIGIQKTEL